MSQLFNVYCYYSNVFFPWNSVRNFM